MDTKGIVLSNEDSLILLVLLRVQKDKYLHYLSDNVVSDYRTVSYYESKLSQVDRIMDVIEKYCNFK